MHVRQHTSVGQARNRDNGSTHSRIDNIQTRYNRGAKTDLIRDDMNHRRRRILFRAWHRGTQEADLILGRFADRLLANLDCMQMDRFDALLNCTDIDLFDWIAGRVAPPPEHDNDVMRMLCATQSLLAGG